MPGMVQQPAYLIPGLPSGMGNNVVVQTDASGLLQSATITPGYVLLGGPSGSPITQATTTNHMLFWDSTNYRLGIGTATPSKALTVTEDILVNNVVVGKGANSLASNTAVGVAALGAITTGVNNTGFGSNALAATTTANNNTAIGASALGSNITGANNTAIGVAALGNQTVGDNNFGIGVQSLFSNAGDGNVGLGNYTLLNNTTGSNSVAIGNAALASNTTGFWNVGVGFGAVNQNQTGYFNVGIGYFALFGSTGIQNIGIGYNSGYQITTGSSNVVIGGYTGSAAPISATGSNYIVLSDGAGNIGAYWNGATGVQFAQAAIVHKGYTVAALTALVAPATGSRAYVTDGASVPAFMGALPAGGGTSVFPVFYNGTAWVAG